MDRLIVERKLDSLQRFAYLPYRVMAHATGTSAGNEAI